MADLRNDLGKAFNIWKASRIDMVLRGQAIYGLTFLDRVEEAFVAGWKACERTEQQRAPSKSQAKRIAAQKGEGYEPLA